MSIREAVRPGDRSPSGEEPVRQVSVAGMARLLAGAAPAASSGAEGDFTPEGLDGAARFLLDAADLRRPGEPLVVVDSVSGGVETRMTRVAVINDDMPFLVDSVAATLAHLGLEIDRLIHPVVPVQRDASGRLLALDESAGEAPLLESVIYLETERADARTRVRLRAALSDTLDDVYAAVADWPAMRAAMQTDAAMLAQADAGEGAELLRWLADGHLTQLGHVLHRRDGSSDAALGVCRTGTPRPLSDASCAQAFAWFERVEGGPSARAPLIVKANAVARVHRRSPLDLFIVPIVEQGRVAALSIHAGLWTSAALASPPDDVPVLRRELAAIMAAHEFDPRGHAGKALVHALTALPHDILLGLDAAELDRLATTAIGLIDRPRPHLLLVHGALGRHLYAFVWLPRDVLSTQLRNQVQAMIAQAAHARVLDWSLDVAGALATIRLLLDMRHARAAGLAPVDEAALAAELRVTVRGWAEAVETELAADAPRGRAVAIARRFAAAFPLGYRTAYGPAEAAKDIARLRLLGPGQERDARLHCQGGCPPGHLRMKLYQRRGALPLSDAVPMLENFGFRVVGETATLLDPQRRNAAGMERGQLGAIHDFLLALPPGLTPEALLARSAEIDAAVAAVLNGGEREGAEDDAFNRLVTGAGLLPREAGWMRAFYRYLRQTGMSYALTTAVDALQAAPGVTRGLIALFVARHDPAFAGDRDAAAAAALADVREGLTAVGAINDDRLLRRFQALVEAIVRTNAFVVPAPDAPPVALAFKIDSAALPKLPRPVPWREVFVHSCQVEGIHLRAGPVARGGLRWSDRRDDFRTEVLGLMKAQRVKNAVIVPTGAKGGFYPKRLPDPALDRDGWLAEGLASYRVFVRSLLSLTDNIVDGAVVHPAGVVVRDADDPYFVVAADKGTATFSDVANAIAAERDFWLDDAFASGGSKGYDHKAMGITARGAWISVQRHFREMGIDVQTDPVRVVGCGDMSGDVFGNGMLLSRSLKLIAAFDHRHVFVDPDPDPQASWTERSRLFALPRSSWADYDPALISRGGGVYPRAAKQIDLSPQARAALGLDAATIEPDALIRAILTAPVDLLWFGGIGTYVKAEAENNAAVGDPANDALRVDAQEVRARVIGEGANLGITQAGRIAYALSSRPGAAVAGGGHADGGRINTDFIDNSAGVDCSDNEVNIKIALASAKRAGRIDEEQRVALLAAMTDDVAAIVLEDNRLQALALSIAEAGGAGAMAPYLGLVDTLEVGGHIDRRTDGIADADVLSRRAADGAGLTRPELAVILSSSKLALQAALERSDLVDDACLVDDLTAAFPAAMRDRFAEDIARHRLRREIIATKLANRIINRIGLMHPFELLEEEGASAEQVVAAFVAAERLFGMAAIWQAIEQADMPEAARILLFTRAADALRPHIADLLRAGAGRTPPSRLVEELAQGVADVARAAQTMLGAETRAQSLNLRAELAAAGAPAAQAAMVADLFDLDGAIGLARLASQTGLAAPALATAFIDLGGRLGLDWAQGRAARLTPTDPWERLLVSGLARDFQHMRLEFLRRATRDERDPAAAVAQWAAAHAGIVAQFRRIVSRARDAVAVSPAMLAQLASQARSLLAR